MAPDRYLTVTEHLQTGTHQQHLLVGVTYAVKQGETVLSVAARFRTTAKSILSLNFDLASSVERCFHRSFYVVLFSFPCVFVSMWIRGALCVHVCVCTCLYFCGCVCV